MKPANRRTQLADEPATAVPAEPITDAVGNGDGALPPDEQGAPTGEPTVAEHGVADPQKRYYASICPGPTKDVPKECAEAVQRLEAALGMPVWVLVQTGGIRNQCEYFSDFLAAEFLREILREPPKKPIAVLVDSPGGDARAAYRLATLIRKHCGEFTAVVPRKAKSAATLFVLGAKRILLGRLGELGPLDVQVEDPEREEGMSALDEVQALERLLAFSLEALDRSMFLMVGRSGKKVKSILPEMSNFVTNLVRPLFENIDVLHYTQMSRVLKVAEEYAVRLLMPHYPRDAAMRIANHLVANYPEHGFVIDADEAAFFGLKTEPFSADVTLATDEFWSALDTATLVGRIAEKGAQ